MAKLAAGNPSGNAEEVSGQFEGDIILNDEQMNAIMGKSPRTGLIDTRYRWPNNEVPYVLTGGTFTQAQIDHIRLGLDTLQSKTCLRFVQRTFQTDYITVTGANTGCWSYVGRSGGNQELNLQLSAPESGCFRLGTVMHEFIHALGVYHMQSAYDRDEYVTIMLQNILSGTESNFNKYTANQVSHFGSHYDYGSVMHYSRTAFSSNGLDTIVTRDPAYQNIIGQRGELSTADTDRINQMYGC